MKESYKELFKYGIVGTVGLMVDWGMFFILRDVLGINYIVSHVLSSTLAITNNFFLNSYFTFKVTDKIWKRAISFFAIAGVGLVLGTALLPTLVSVINNCLQHFDIQYENQKVIQNAAKLGVTVFVAFLQFFLNKFFTFKKQSL